MSTVCYCGQPDCPVTTWEHDACVANLRAERDALKAQLVEAVEVLRELFDKGEGCPACGKAETPGCGCQHERASTFLAKVKP